MNWYHNTNIEEMQLNFIELARLTDYVISRNNILEGIETLTKQWSDNFETIKETAEDLKEYTDDLVTLKRELAEERSVWNERKAFFFTFHSFIIPFHSLFPFLHFKHSEAGRLEV